MRTYRQSKGKTGMERTPGGLQTEGEFIRGKSRIFSKKLEVDVAQPQRLGNQRKDGYGNAKDGRARKKRGKKIGGTVSWSQQ